MELLQSQAPVDQELSGSSASGRHGTSDIGQKKAAKELPQNWNFFKIFK